MTSPREQAIEEAAKEHYEEVRRIVEPGFGIPLQTWDEMDERERDINRRQARAAIDAYESARARLDGAKMMPREATQEMCIAGGEAQTLSIGSWGEPFVVYRAMHDATPKELRDAD